MQLGTAILVTLLLVRGLHQGDEAATRRQLVDDGGGIGGLEDEGLRGLLELDREAVARVVDQQVGDLRVREALLGLLAALLLDDDLLGERLDDARLVATAHFEHRRCWAGRWEEAAGMRFQ